MQMEGQSGCEEALEERKRGTKSVRGGKQARPGSTPAAGSEAEERMRRHEERLGVVEEALHALQAKLSA